MKNTVRGVMVVGRRSRHKRRQLLKTTLEKITHFTKEWLRELIPLWLVEKSGKEWWKSRGLNAAADGLIRCRCGDAPGEGSPESQPER